MNITVKCALLWLLVVLIANLTSGQYPINPIGGYGGMLPGQCYDGFPKEMVPGMACYSQVDCTQRNSYAECEWNPLGGQPTTQKMCYCRCGYRWDIHSMSCVNRDNCWYCSSGVILGIIITILVVVVIVAVFTIPTCALVSCMGNKQ